MDKRVLWAGVLAAMVLGGCVVSTDTVPGEPGPRGETGPTGATGSDGVSPFILHEDGSITYTGGAVGIGTETPTRGFDVAQNVAGHARIGLYNTSNDPSAAEILEIAAGSDGHDCALQLSMFATNNMESLTDADGNKLPLNNFGGLYTNCASPPGGLMVGTGDVGPTIFITDGQERMRIGGDGSVGIGTATPNGKMTINAAGFNSNSIPVLSLRNLNNDAATYAMAVGSEDGGTDMFALRARGDGSNMLDLFISGDATKPTGASWTVSSDARLKTDIKSISGALNRLLALRGVTYRWREPLKHGNLSGTQLGMIAQEVEKVFPDWIGTDREGFKTLTIRGFEALAIESFRELKTENDTLRREVAALTDKADRTAKLEADLAAERAARQKLEARLTAIEAKLVAPVRPSSH